VNDMDKLTDVEGIKNRHLQHCSAGMFTNRSDWERVARQMHYDTGMLLEHIRRQDKQIAELTEKVEFMSAVIEGEKGYAFELAEKDKLIAELQAETAEPQDFPDDLARAVMRHFIMTE